MGIQPNDDLEDEEATQLVKELLKRYSGSPFEMLQQAIVPMRAVIIEINDTEFVAKYPKSRIHIIPGKTGKVIPKESTTGDQVWREIVKGRVCEIEDDQFIGELYAMRKSDLEKGLKEVKVGDFFEIDCFGAMSKIESGMTEAALAEVALREGYNVTRMPENIAVHIKPNLEKFLEGTTLPESVIEIIKKDERAKGWPNFDFLIEKDGISRRMEVKSLWGTDTSKARLIHTKGGRWETSSCRFEDQDIFAVNLWLRTGNIMNFGFARSVLKDASHPYGLPAATKREDGEKVLIPEHVHQNPDCEIGNGSWFEKIDEVWELF